jgi:surface antigen
VHGVGVDVLAVSDRRKAAALAVGVLVCLTLGLGKTGGARADGSGIRLWSNVTKADDSVAVRVSLGGFPNEQCAGEIHKGSEVVDAGTVATSANGGASWSWQIPGNVRGGAWEFTVTCSGGPTLHKAKTRFIASGGVGPAAKGLSVPGTLHRRSVDQPHSLEGNGGRGSLSYPIGQSTWWVGEHRPDLPFFPGRSGDALNWAKTAAAKGFPVGRKPQVGAVAVFGPGQYGAGRFGHVALVVAVKGARIRISEAGFRGQGHDTRTVGYRGVSFIYRKGNPAPGLSAIFTAPTPDRTVQGTVTITATSNAPGVRFAAYYLTNPADRDSGRWQPLGDDRTPGNGFSVTWDTTAAPNQGSPGAPSVLIRASVLDREGSPTGAFADVRVDLANSRSAGGQTYFPYFVVGTCEEGECGVPMRSGPGTGYPALGARRDGEELDIVCQAGGEPFTSHFGGTSSIWDKLTDGSWAPDYFANTPVHGAPSPPIPGCP